MKIVTTCPTCGKKVEVEIELPEHSWPLEWVVPAYDSMPDPCRHCSNHPRNGGTGICHCAVPYMTKTGSATYYSTITTK